MGVVTLSAPYGASPIKIETGRLARQADGAVLVTRATPSCSSPSGAPRAPVPASTSCPSPVEYVEKQYAAGKIPGGYFKREARQGQLGDPHLPPHRPPPAPAVPQALARRDPDHRDRHVDGQRERSGHLRHGRRLGGGRHQRHALRWPGGRLPRLPDRRPVRHQPVAQGAKDAELDLIVAGTSDAVCMVEGEASEASESTIVDAILAAHEAIKPVIKLQRDLVAKAGKPKRVAAPPVDAELYNRVIDVALDDMADALAIRDKKARRDARSRPPRRRSPAHRRRRCPRSPAEEINEHLHDLQSDIVRTQVVEEGIRLDGRRSRRSARSPASSICCPGPTARRSSARRDAGPRDGHARHPPRRAAHRQPAGRRLRPFMLHYNFPPFCTGEVKMLRGRAGVRSATATSPTAASRT
jgi:polyribonucleotide nucleotidyltransferase